MIRAALLVSTAWLLVSCGYSLGLAGSGTLGRIAVFAPENDTPWVGLERVVADALRREVMRRPGSALIEDPERADWVLRGRVLPLERSASSLSPVVLALERELTLSIELNAVSRDGREVAIGAKSLRETERYLASADVEAQRKNHDEALRRAATLLATRFLDRMAEEAARTPPANAAEGS